MRDLADRLAESIDLGNAFENPLRGVPSAWLGKGLVRFLLLLVAAAAVAAVAAGFGIAHDYGYLHASILTGSFQP
jgi:hypothetical protein